MNFTKLDQQVVQIICCPLCKGPVERRFHTESFLCRACNTAYPTVTVAHTTHEEHIYDFRISRPSYCIPDGASRWRLIQREFEDSCHLERRRHDNLTTYLSEIDSVTEIYSEEFPHIRGSVLDVGGYNGTLRHFIAPAGVPLYVSVDPLLEAFAGSESMPNLLKAYPCLAEPCNFLACHAEHLPFAPSSFDWVHMRSVLDHFADPYLAMKEAYRVLKPGGAILIGLTVHGGQSSLKATGNARGISACRAYCSAMLARVVTKARIDGVTGLLKSITSSLRRRRLPGIADDHMFQWRYEDLQDLLQVVNLDITKEHWQKQPFDMCIYIMARKRQRVRDLPQEPFLP